MNIPQGTQEVGHSRPHPLARVDGDFAEAIAIIIPRSFFLAVADGRVHTDNVVVTLPLVGEHHSLRQSEGMDVADQSLFVGMVDHPQTDLPALTSNGANNRGSVMVIGAVPTSFVRSSARWISRMTVRFPFFPPHSETSRRFPSAGQVRALGVVT